MSVIISGSTGITLPDSGALSTSIGDAINITSGYVSGIQLGGTATANKLDDYEEGTFSATVGTGTATYLYGEYVKVGSSVTASCLVYNFSNITSTGDQITLALPFASNSSGFGGAGNVMFRYISGVDDVTVSPHIGVNSSILEFFQCNSQNYVTLKHSQLGNSSSRIYFTVTYKTDA